MPSSLFSPRQMNFAVGQAIGVLVYSVGSTNGANVSDSFRTNRDWGRAQPQVGTLTITATSPQIRGSFNFSASGDGYPTINPTCFATVSGGSFCITP